MGSACRDRGSNFLFSLLDRVGILILVVRGGCGVGYPVLKGREKGGLRGKKGGENASPKFVSGLFFSFLLSFPAPLVS